MGRHGEKAKLRRATKRALSQTEAASGHHPRRWRGAARRLVRCVGAVFAVPPTVDLSDLAVFTVVSFLYRRRAVGQQAPAAPLQRSERARGATNINDRSTPNTVEVGAGRRQPATPRVRAPPVNPARPASAPTVSARTAHAGPARPVLAQLRLDRDAARVARGLVLRTQRGRLSSVSLQPADDGPTLFSLTDVARLRSRDAARAQAYASERRSQARRRRVSGAAQSAAFGVRIERRLDLGPLTPARGALCAAEREAVLRACAEFLQGFDGEHVFIETEILRGTVRCYSQ